MIPPLDQAKFWICCSYYTYLRTDRRDWKGHTPLDRNHHRKVPEKQKGKGTCRAVWSPADFYLFHRWIKLSFGYVVLITLIYELTGGIERDTLYLTEIIIGHFLKNKKEMHLQGSFIADRFLSLTPLDRAYVWICGATRCGLHSGRWRSETHALARFGSCWTVARPFSGEIAESVQ